MVSIKSAREIELMREAGKILACVHDELGEALNVRIILNMPAFHPCGV